MATHHFALIKNYDRKSDISIRQQLSDAKDATHRRHMGLLGEISADRGRFAMVEMNLETLRTERSNYLQDYAARQQNTPLRNSDLLSEELANAIW